MLRRLGAERARMFRTVLMIGLSLPLIMAPDSCPDGEDAQATAAVILMFVDRNVAGIQITESLRVHRYPKPIPKNAVVRPYSLLAEDRAQDTRTCEGNEGCVLFFVDTDHWAHFSHPTVTVLWDPGAGRATDRVKWVAGGWWPLVNGEPIFNTVRSREDRGGPADPDWVPTVVYPTRTEQPYRPGDEVSFSVLRVSESQPPVVPILALTASTPCPVWAVLIAGYGDPDDTFDTDVDGMETVLRGQRVPANHIFVLSPRYADGSASTGPEETTRLEVTKENIEDVLTNKLKAAIGDNHCKDLLLMISSHGEINEILTGRNSITSSELQGLLSQVPCDNVTVALEACHSGSFIDELMPGPTPVSSQTEGNVVQQQKRLLMTSTRSDGKSMRDEDELEGTYDTNPGDLGSETMWGFIEAFGTSIADADGGHVVSFSEAFGYAEKNDLTSQVGINTPQARPTPAPDEVVNTCPSGAATYSSKITLTQETPTAPAGPGELLRCRCNLFKAEITSPGHNPPPVATARFFWTDVADPTWNARSQPHFKEVWNSTQLLAAQSAPHEFVVKWDVGSKIRAGSVVTLLAVVDSPGLPVPHGEVELPEFLRNNPQASALTLKVVNPSSCFVFPCGCVTARCESASN